jgi:magnesium transporter
MSPRTSYPENTVGSIMSVDVPVHLPSVTCGEVLTELANDVEWDDIHHIYIVDEQQTFLGYVPLSRAIKTSRKTKLEHLVQKAPATLHVDNDQEEAVFEAVKTDLDAIPVIDSHNRLKGVVTASSILDVMHSEHVEDVLFAAGIRRGGETNFVKLASARLLPVLRTRAPWLIAGSIVGMSLGFVSSQFDAALEKTLALAYFIPVIAYISNSVGTQTEAITVRALATLKINYSTYLLREFTLGAMLGTILGALGGFGSWFISGDAGVAAVVGLSLIAASTVATGLAAGIPILFKLAGKDPALGSGPIATALQDILSLVVYFMFALIILGT